MERPFAQVDVFTATPYAGNPVAVVLDADGLDDETMARFAAWTNLSETTFVLPPTDPGADYRVRIFTPSAELPFAGHPTLGTCAAWLEAGGRPRDDGRVVQECEAGLIAVRRNAAGGLAFATPPLRRSGPLDEPLLDRVAAFLGLAAADVVDAQWVDNGPGWLAVLLADAEAVLALPRPPSPGDLHVGVIGPYPAGAPVAFEVRAFTSLVSGGEDPVTGSLNGSLAQWLLASGRAEAPYVAAQGTAMGRAGRVRIETDAEGAIWVGGDTVTCIAGRVTL